MFAFLQIQVYYSSLAYIFVIFSYFKFYDQLVKRFFLNCNFKKIIFKISKYYLFTNDRNDIFLIIIFKISISFLLAFFITINLNIHIIFIEQK